MNSPRRIRILFALSVLFVFRIGMTAAVMGYQLNASQAISLVISPHGFAQTNLSVPAGSYLFVLLNRTGFSDITVYLERMPANGVSDAPIEEFVEAMSPNRSRLARASKLLPGTYRLRVTNRASWICAIRVN